MITHNKVPFVSDSNIIADNLYEVLYKAINTQLFNALEELGRKNNIITDAQTYSFIYKGKTHQSRLVHFNNAKVKLDKQFHSDAECIYTTGLAIYHEYLGIHRMMAFVLSSPKKYAYLELFPQEIRELNWNYKNKPESNIDVLTESDTDTFLTKYAIPFDDLRTRLVLNSLTV